MRKSSRGMWWLLTAMLVLLACGQSRAKTSYGEILCADTENYECLTIPKKIRQVVADGSDVFKTPTWKIFFPEVQQRELVKMINRRNNSLQPGQKIAVPYNLDEQTDYLSWAPFPQNICPYDFLEEQCLSRNQEIVGTIPYQWQIEYGAQYCLLEKTLVFDPQTLAFAAYNEFGWLEKWGPASGGKDYCSDIQRSCRTPTGTFRVAYKVGADYRSSTYPKDCQGNGCAPIPYAIFFQDGAAFHASDNLPGYNASHGCVRLNLKDAKWLNQEFVEPTTKIIILPYGEKGRLEASR